MREPLVIKYLLDTKASALYISATDIINIAKKVDIHLHMSSREKLLSELLQKSLTCKSIDRTYMHISLLIDKTIKEYKSLHVRYPSAELAKLIQKATDTKNKIKKMQI